jgi:hypothetical protein
LYFESYIPLEEADKNFLEGRVTERQLKQKPAQKSAGFCSMSKIDDSVRTEWDLTHAGQSKLHQPGGR